MRDGSNCICSTPLLQGISSRTLCPTGASNQTQVRPQDRQHALLRSQNSCPPCPIVPSNGSHKTCWAYSRTLEAAPGMPQRVLRSAFEAARDYRRPCLWKPTLMFQQYSPCPFSYKSAWTKMCLTTRLCFLCSIKRVVGSRNSILKDLSFGIIVGYPAHDCLYLTIWQSFFLKPLLISVKGWWFSSTPLDTSAVSTFKHMLIPLELAFDVFSTDIGLWVESNSPCTFVFLLEQPSLGLVSSLVYSSLPGSKSHHSTCIQETLSCETHRHV